MTPPIDLNKQEDSGVDPTSLQPVAESNADGEDKAPTCDSLTDNTKEEPFNFIKEYYGKESSEVEHLLKLPAEIEKNDKEDFYDNAFIGSLIESQASTDSHDDPLADIINDLDNVILSDSNLSCDTTSDIEYLNFDIFKYETILAQVRHWHIDEEPEHVLYYPEYNDIDSEP